MQEAELTRARWLTASGRLCGIEGLNTVFGLFSPIVTVGRAPIQGALAARTGGDWPAGGSHPTARASWPAPTGGVT